MRMEVDDSLPSDYITWQISPERQKHDWMQLRRFIVRTRWRIALYGHVAYFIACSALKTLGVQCNDFISLGWWSLLIIGMALLIIEWMHVHALPATPPRFVVRRSGLTEYGEDGPRMHWDWERTAQLSIETDRERPAFRSLVVAMKAETLMVGKFCRISIPLPGDDDEFAIIEAVSRALEDNRIDWAPRPNGAVALVRPPAE